MTKNKEDYISYKEYQKILNILLEKKIARWQVRDKK